MSTPSESLFDNLSGAFGHGVDRPGLNAFVAQSQARNGLVSAQTEEALNNAALQREKLQADSDLEAAIGGTLGPDGKPLHTPTEAHAIKTLLVGRFGDAKNVMDAMNMAQKTHLTDIASAPENLGTPAQTAALAGLKGTSPDVENIPLQYAVRPGMPEPVVHVSPLAGSQENKNNAAADKAHAPAADLDDDAAYNAAIKYNQFGTLPPLGMGGGQGRAKILGFAAQLSHNPEWHPPSWDIPQQPPAGAAPAPGAAHSNPTGTTAHPTLQNATDAASNPTDMKAQTAMMADMTKRTGIADSAEQTALKNLDLARQKLAEADQTGSPLANTIQNKIRSGLFGDPQVSAYHNALSTARNEYARVISMATGATGITDFAMKEGQRLFPDDLAPEQFESNFSVAKQEMANRTGAMHAQIAAAKSKIHTPVGSTPAPGPAPSTTPAPAPTILRFDAQGNMLPNGPAQ